MCILQHSFVILLMVILLTRSLVNYLPFLLQGIFKYCMTPFQSISLKSLNEIITIWWYTTFLKYSLASIITPNLGWRSAFIVPLISPDSIHWLHSLQLLDLKCFLKGISLRGEKAPVRGFIRIMNYLNFNRFLLIISILSISCRLYWNDIINISKGNLFLFFHGLRTQESMRTTLPKISSCRLLMLLDISIWEWWSILV